ncbi:MAG: putative glycosyltransferase [Cryomorphaceae bacterium]|jgi:predicted glycosyltransferase
MGHPAHYHNLKNCIRILLERGDEVLVAARGKDVLFDLIETEDWNVVKWPARASGSKLSLILNILQREAKLLNVVRKFRPHLMAGTDLGITHVGKLLGIPSVVVNEDDSHAIPLMAKYAFPYATNILAPNCCDQSPANHKKIGYEGYHELAYLHPNYFSPDRTLLPSEMREAKRYFILRFASLHAHHDDGRSGIDDALANDLINLLEPFGKVFITSERELSEHLEPYRIPVHPAVIHHAMAFADLYIGDSQTMAAEAAVLGVPSIRFNDFVGELSYLEELEHTYELTKGIKTTEPKLLLATAKEWAENTALKTLFAERRTKMTNATIDVTKRWIEVFDNLVKTHQ